MSDVTVLKVVVLSPSRRLAETTATQVLVPGFDGELGILPGHTTLVVQLGFGVLTIIGPSGRSFFAVEGGVAEVRDNVLTVLADGAEDAATIDPARAEKALQRAKERRGGSKAGEVVDFERARRAEARALARIDAHARLQLPRG